MDFENYLLESAQKTEREVDAILKKWREEVENINQGLLSLVDEFIKSNQGGKRIRGVLVRMGYELAKSKVKSQKSKVKEDIFKIAAAYEILHTSILAHDDIMDQDIQRRGQPSLYQAISGLGSPPGGNHYGISQAISLADAGFFLSVKAIAESEFEERLKNKALNLFSKTMVDTSVGQMLDVGLTQSGHTSEESEPTSEVIAQINLLKTARYTISGPLKIGAVLAGADDKLLNLLDLFGENLGIAYQIRDDILDNEVKSVEDAKKRVLEYSAKALKLIPEITKELEFRKLLEELIEYLIQRSK